MGGNPPGQGEQKPPGSASIKSPGNGRESAVAAGWRECLLAYALAFTFLFTTHVALLRLPYFWDEAGYFIPAARDLLLTGSLIPHTTLSNAHPPLVMLWLAFWWKFSAFTPAVTRTAMLMLAAFAFVGLWRLSRDVANRTVAAATVLCTVLYPVFFAQSSLAHLDMMAAALTLWGLAMYVERRPVATIVFFALAPLAKETASVTPMALFAWELLCPLLVGPRKPERETLCPPGRSKRQAFSFLLCLLPLLLWFAYHHHRTGFYLGNPAYLRYNLQATLNPLRIVLALLIRLWHVLGYLNLFLLTLGALFAMTRPALPDKDGGLRPRIAVNVQLVFAVVLVSNILAESVLGGAVLARYMLPVIPLVILICVSTMRRRLRRWAWWIAFTCIAFVVQLFVPPPYRIAPEDTLLYRDYVILHKIAADELASRFPSRSSAHRMAGFGRTQAPISGICHSADDCRAAGELLTVGDRARRAGDRPVRCRVSVYHEVGAAASPSSTARLWGGATGAVLRLSPGYFAAACSRHSGGKNCSLPEPEQ